MSENSKKDEMRLRYDTRAFALETLNGMIQWIVTTNPRNLYGSTDEKLTKYAGATTPDDQMQQKYRDWLNNSADIIKDCNRLPPLIVEDAFNLLEEMKQKRVANAQPQTTPNSK